MDGHEGVSCGWARGGELWDWHEGVSCEWARGGELWMGTWG